jgi:hypothetical protein
MHEKTESFVIIRSFHANEDPVIFDPFVVREGTTWPTSAWPKLVKLTDESPADLLEVENL